MVEQHGTFAHRECTRSFCLPDEANDPNVQDPHRVVQCRFAPHVMWAQYHNGIFRTTDGGRIWNEVTNVQPS